MPLNFTEVKYERHRCECFQGKVGQVLSELVLHVDYRTLLTEITSEQPKGLFGL